MNETPTGCVFCGIIAGTEPATIVQEWPDAIAFLPHNPVASPDGHVLVVPRVHVPDAVMRTDITAATMARAAELAAAHDASNIITSVGRAATQTVFHLHIHVIRREAGDQLMVPWGTTGDPHAPHRCRLADSEPEPPDDDPNEDAAHALAEGLADWRENLAPLDEATKGYRTQLVADGWSAEAAEHMALSFYGTHVQMLNNAIEGAADA